MLINKRELWKLLLPAEGIITTVKIEVRLKIVMFLTALYFYYPYFIFGYLGLFI